MKTKTTIAMHRLLSALVLSFVVSLSVFGQGGGKYRGAVELESPAGRFIVALSDMTAAEEVSAVAASLAATYGLRLEPFAQEGFRGFAVTGSTARARLLSADGRVAWVEVQRSANATAVPTPAAPPVVAAAAAPAAVPSGESLTEVTASGRTPRDVGSDAASYSWKATYRYDGAGNIIGITREEPGVAPSTDYYAYDGVGRLRAASADTATETTDVTYAYDRYGNITDVVYSDAIGSLAKKMAVNPATNRLDNSGVCIGSNCYVATYDDAGNVTSFAGATYAWDALGMMTELKTESRHEFYVYDGSNERIATVILPPLTKEPQEYRYTLRGLDNEVVREWTHRVAGGDVWQWKKDYVYRGGALLASLSPKGGSPDAERLHYHLDHLGTPRLVTDDTGLRRALYTLLPFGLDAPGSDTDTERMKFTGHERDDGGTTGYDLDYMHARYYSPTLGRFLSVDPLLGASRNSQSWNRYTYVLNRPTVLVDPSGLSATRYDPGAPCPPGAQGPCSTFSDILSPAELLARLSRNLYLEHYAEFLVGRGRHPLSGMTLREHWWVTELAITEFVDGVIPFLDVDDYGYSEIDGLQYSEKVGEYTRNIEFALASSGSATIFGHGRWLNTGRHFRIGHSTQLIKGGPNRVWFSARGATVRKLTGKDHVNFWVVRYLPRGAAK